MLGSATRSPVPGAQIKSQVRYVTPHRGIASPRRILRTGFLGEEIPD